MHTPFYVKKCPYILRIAFLIRTILKKLALKDPALAKRLFDAGVVVVPEGPEGLAAVVKRQTEATARLAEVLGVKAKE